MRGSPYASRPRKDAFSIKNVYITLLLGAICCSTWALLSQQVSSILPSHHSRVGRSSSSTWSQLNSGSGSSSRAHSSQRRLQQQLNVILRLAAARMPDLDTAKAAAVVTAERATAGEHGHEGGGVRRLAFQRTKTAMPFIMMTCRMCDDPVSAAVQEHKLYDAVTTTLLEHAISNAPEYSRVFVEVGAGTGYFSMVAASWGTDVVTFEPGAAARVLLQRNAALHKDGRLRVVPYAVGANTTLASLLANRQAQDNTTSTGISTSNSSSSNSSSISSNNSSSSSSSGSSSSSSSTTSSSGAVRRYPVDVVRLSEAIDADVAVTVLLVNAAALDGVSVPDVQAALEGAFEMLQRTEWLFVVGLPKHNSPGMRALLANTLQHGQFKYLYNYGTPPQSEQQRQPKEQQQSEQQQLLQEGLDAQRESQEQPKGQQQKQQQGVSYPADIHFVDVTQSVVNTGEQLQHNSFLFRREPLSTALQIKLPPKVMWDWQVLAAAQADNAAAGGADGEPQQVPVQAVS